MESPNTSDGLNNRNKLSVLVEFGFVTDKCTKHFLSIFMMAASDKSFGTVTFPPDFLVLRYFNTDAIVRYQSHVTLHAADQMFEFFITWILTTLNQYFREHFARHISLKQKKNALLIFGNDTWKLAIPFNRKRTNNYWAMIVEQKKVYVCHHGIWCTVFRRKQV